MTDHPTDLLERVADDRATDPERALLELHLATCPVCQIELGFARDRRALGADERGDALVVARIRRSALRSLAARAVPRRTRFTRLKAALVVAAVLSGAGAAAAWFSRAPSRARVSLAESANSVAFSVSQRGLPKTAPEADSAAQAAPLAEATPPVAAADEPARRRTASTNLGSRGTESDTEEPSPPSAAGLFAEANRARRGGETARAVALYRSLERQFPSSQEALVSKVTLGRMLLDRFADPAGALAHYDSYLGVSGNRALREEALIGRALSLGRLGRRAEERQAWQHLLRAFPESAYAKSARTRLAELERLAPQARR